MDAEFLMTEYLEGKQTYAQLALKHGCSEKTIRRHIDRVRITYRKEFSPVANVVMDTTYFGRKFGVMAFKNSLDGRMLRSISLSLVHCSKQDFSAKLDAWYEKWRDVLNERTKNPESGRSTYTHKPWRSAYRSLRNNMDHLFVFEEYRELDIPNTTNALDGQFSDLKNKLRNHNGLSLERKKRMIDRYLGV